MRATVVRVSAACLCVLSTACQTYSTVAAGSIARGEDLHVILSEQGSDALATSAVGPRAAALDGTVVSRDSAGVRLAVVQVLRGDGQQEYMHGEQVLVPADAIATVQRKQIQPVRSALLAGAIIAGSAFVAGGGVGDIFGGSGRGAKSGGTK